MGSCSEHMITTAIGFFGPGVFLVMLSVGWIRGHVSVISSRHLVFYNILLVVFIILVVHPEWLHEDFSNLFTYETVKSSLFSILIFIALTIYMMTLRHRRVLFMLNLPENSLDRMVEEVMGRTLLRWEEITEEVRSRPKKERWYTFEHEASRAWSVQPNGPEVWLSSGMLTVEGKGDRTLVDPFLQKLAEKLKQVQQPENRTYVGAFLGGSIMVLIFAGVVLYCLK